MRKWLRATWEWWRRDCVPVSMLAIVLAAGLGAYRIGDIGDSLRSSAREISDISYSLGGSGPGGFSTGYLSEIESGLDAIGYGLYGIEGALGGSLRLQCAE